MLSVAIRPPPPTGSRVLLAESSNFASSCFIHPHPEKGDSEMAGNESAARRRADERVAEARKAGSSKEVIGKLQAAREVARDAELGKTGGSRQAGER